MRFCNIASGSSGNCTYAGDDETHLLIDAGISGKRIEAGLNGLDLTTADLNGILVTHEHTDHIGGLGVIARRYDLPIYATPGTIEAISSQPRLNIPDHLFHVVRADEEFSIGGFDILPVPVSHDAAEPVAYRLENNGTRVSIATDLGIYDDHMVECMRDSDLLMLEANHDVHMLEVGPYPYMLKRRILGEKGHLSNDLCGRLLTELISDRLQQVILGHLSKDNNMEELAYETVRLEVTMSDDNYRWGDFPVCIAKRCEATDCFEVKAG
ncbi:MAG: MBL fold metallo-hydrolase [Lachnospiraceae bacterium]|nr:MBL fold metallo-hydrolase [Lachnospiraceae bacterium]